MSGLPETGSTAGAESAEADCGREPVPRIDLLGCAVDLLDLDSTADRCLELIRAGGGAWQASFNSFKADLCHRDPAFARTLAAADIVSADGMSIVWASRLLRRPLPGRVSGTDLLHELLVRADRNSLSVYVLGARSDVLARALEALRWRYPGARILGGHHGYFEDAEEEVIVSEIRRAAPDLLFIALPSPRKERFIHENVGRLDAGFTMGVGGAIEVVAGEKRRAPDWVQQSGFEWLYRLAQDPRSLWKRYLRANVQVLRLLALEIVRRGRAPAR